MIRTRHCISPDTTALQVYERGVLIISGMYGLNEDDEEEMQKNECILDLNMALVSGLKSTRELSSHPNKS